MTTLFGRNPALMAVIGAVLLIAGLAIHAVLMPWIGGALLVIGGVKAALGRRLRGPARDQDRDRDRDRSW
jgi:membrane protein implicated in regulation of membrane protease activity